MIDTIMYRRFLSEEEYVESFTSRGETIPPFLLFQPFVIRDNVEGYMVPCGENHPEAESQITSDSSSDPGISWID